MDLDAESWFRRLPWTSPTGVEGDYKRMQERCQTELDYVRGVLKHYRPGPTYSTLKVMEATLVYILTGDEEIIKKRQKL